MLDQNKVCFDRQHLSGYKVDYVFLRSNTDAILTMEEVESFDGKFTRGAACYSQFFNKLSDLKGENRPSHIYTELDLVPTAGASIVAAEALQYVKACKDNEFLPAYVDPSSTIKLAEGDEPLPKRNSTLTAHLTLLFEDKPQSKIYFYLDTFRHLREDPGFVKAVNYLHWEKGIDFCISYVLASHFNISGVGHHSLRITKGPYDNGNAPNPENVDGKVNLKMARNLYRFIHDIDINFGNIIGQNASGWNCNGLIERISSENYVVPIKDLKDPLVIALTHEFDDNKAKELFKEYKKNQKGK